mgnify:CR=1 FL=1
MAVYLSVVVIVQFFLVIVDGAGFLVNPIFAELVNLPGRAICRLCTKLFQRFLFSFYKFCFVAILEGPKAYIVDFC